MMIRGVLFTPGLQHLILFFLYIFIQQYILNIILDMCREKQDDLPA